MSDALNRLLAPLGRAGVVALGLTLATLLFWWQSIGPAQHQLAALQARAAHLQAQLPLTPPPAAVPEDHKGRVVAYFRSFPALSAMPQAIADVLQLAGTLDLNIDKVDYGYQPLRQDDLATLQMGFALKGAYPKLRRFVITVLSQHPAVALEELTLRRDGIGSTEVEARIRLTLYATGTP